jgi:hypothetical protein
MQDRQDKYEALLSEIAGRRTELENLSSRTTNVIDELENKILPYLQKSQNLPNIANLCVVLEGLASMYKIKQDTDEKIIKSLERAIELHFKYVPEIDDENEDSKMPNYQELVAAMKSAIQMDKRD